MAKTVAKLFTLPAELLDDILSTIDKADLKQFRCVSHACADLGAPYVFDEILFDLEPGGSDNLCAIARHSKLRHRVRTIRLQRRNIYRNFECYDHWWESTAYAWGFWMSEIDCRDIPTGPQFMSQEEWDDLSEPQHELLYEEYEAERIQQDAYMSRFAKATFPRSPNANGLSTYGPVSDAEQIVKDFTAAVPALTNLTACKYTDASNDQERWHYTWRRIVFHLDDSVHPSHVFDRIVDMDTLQHFAALRVVTMFSKSLRSVEAFSFGPAFWTTRDLCNLLDWNHDRPLDSCSQHQVSSPLKMFERAAAVTRHLIDWERSFARLTELTCCIDCEAWPNGGSGPNGLSISLTRFLREARNLVGLTFMTRHETCYTNGKICSCLLMHATCSRPFHKAKLTDITVSRHMILQASPTFKNLRRLQLSCMTNTADFALLLSQLDNLRHLQLDNICFRFGGGTWEWAFRQIAQRLRLQSIDLWTLSDFPFRDSPYCSRVLLHTFAPPWHPGIANRYDEYLEAIKHFLLHNSKVLPPLNPLEFCKQRPLPAASATPAAKEDREEKTAVEDGSKKTKNQNKAQNHQGKENVALGEEKTGSDG